LNFFSSLQRQKPKQSPSYFAEKTEHSIADCTRHQGQAMVGQWSAAAVPQAKAFDLPAMGLHRDSRSTFGAMFTSIVILSD
jgi:hypothetical protein